MFETFYKIMILNSGTLFDVDLYYASHQVTCVTSDICDWWHVTSCLHFISDIKSCQLETKLQWNAPNNQYSLKSIYKYRILCIDCNSCDFSEKRHRLKGSFRLGLNMIDVKACYKIYIFLEKINFWTEDPSLIQPII